MSEPPLKKKRTILDFFSTKNKSGDSKKTKKAMEKKPEETPGESGIGSKNGGADNTDAVDGSVSGMKPALKVNKNEKPGTSKAKAEPLEPTLVMSDSQDSPIDLTEEADSQNSESSLRIPTRKPSQRRDGSTAWKGTPLKMLNKVPDCLADMGSLHSSDAHTVLFKTPFHYDGKRLPTPYATFKDRWDGEHVRMPCSNQNEYPVQGQHGKNTVRRRWEMIQETLLAPIPGPFELEEAILQYNSRYFNKWSFRVLHQLFTDELESEERLFFFDHTLKKMAHLALQLPHLCTYAIPLLKKGQNRSITLSQQQIACLLANAFFCTFPRRNTKQKSSEYFNYPSINFNTMFMGEPTQVKLEKVKCIIHYFTRVTKEMPKGCVTFTRQALTKTPVWDEQSTIYLQGLHVSSEGTIEDDGEGFLQVDFANRILGGGVLGHGCVQEEIRFLICPEMIVSRLFTESLDKNECLIMTGCERFSNYDGYASSFLWKENYIDKTPRDPWGRICCDVVAIDALYLSDRMSQFSAGSVKRELNKALCGFVPPDKRQYLHLPAVCTGNWGCGAFGGDKRLKALIQLMAAAVAKRDVCYYTFDDQKLRDELYSIHKFLTTNLLSIGDIMKLIEHYRRCLVGGWFNRKSKTKLNLFEFIVKTFDGSLEETDDSSNQSGDSLEMQHYQDKMSSDITAEADWEVDLDGGSSTTLKKQTSDDYKANTP